MGTFEDYLKFEVTEAEEDKKQLRIIEKISLSEETEKAVKIINKDITIIAEFPAVVKKEMDKNPENFEDIKYNFRIGKFNAEIEKELVDYLTSL